MTKQRILLLIFFIYGTLKICSAEAERFFDRYNFLFITEKSGLPHCFVEDLLQDSDGYVWAATHYGIARYDGYQTLCFNSRTSPVRLKGDFVHALCEDNRKRLWVASEDGIDIIDLHTYRPVRLSLPADSALHRLMGQYIHTLYKDARGNMWVASDNDLWCIELDQEGDVSNYRRLNMPRPPGSPIHAITDMNGKICAGIDNGIRLISPDGKGHALTVEPLSPGVIPFSEDWRISCMQTDGDWLWFGSNRGLFRYNVRTTQLKRYRYSTHRPGMLSQAYITDIKLTASGRLIVSTLNGVNVYDRDTDTFSFIRQAGNRSGASSINCNAVHCILTTGETIWLGTGTGGINLLSPKSLRTELWHCPLPSGKKLTAPVNAIAEDTDGHLWLSLLEQGLAHWDIEAGTCRRYLFSPNDTTSISNNTLNGILIDSERQAWIYTWGVGINKLDLNIPHNRHFQRYYTRGKHALKGDFINTACEDTLNALIWFGSTQGVIYYDKQEDCFGRIQFREADNEFESISKLLIDRNGRMWAGTTQGVFIIDLHSFARSRQNFDYTYLAYKLDRPITQRLEKINCILEDREGHIWLGGNGTGLYLLTGDSGGNFTFINYTSEHGLASNTIIGMAEDKDRNLWMMTNEGVSKLSLSTMTFTNYTQADGLPDTQYYHNGICYSPVHDLIYLATTDGLLVIRLADKHIRPHEEPVVRLSELTVNGTPLYPADDTHMKQNITHTPSITLHEKESRFSISLTTCNYGNSSRVRFAYRLKGYEKEWNETHPGDCMARYTAVPPGKYILQVRATDETGHWAGQTTEVEVNIRPYFYKSVWFHLPLLALVCLAGWWYNRRKMRRYREQRIRLEQKVAERTQELAVRNRQLEDMARHVNEVTEEKITFFTNITHELRTPVTLIHGPIRLALKKVKEPEVEEQLQIAGRNADYLLSLVNELMDFRKLDMNMVTLDRESCDFVKFLSNLLLPFRVFAKERQIEIRSCFRLPDPCLRLDTAYMRKALVNLVSNALKFTPNGGHIDLYAAAIHDGQGQPLLYINVRDTGHGIVKEDLDKIFDRFYQSKKQVSYAGPGQSGTGIGLYLCRKIIALHGGTIHARNNPGQGASLRILMPLIPGNPVADETPQPALTHPQKPENVPAAEGKRRDTILVVEDNKDMRDYIGMLLEDSYRVLKAENGAEALDIVKREAVDLIVSDLMMPVMDGAELSRRIKENLATSHIPFLMLTAIRSDVQEKESLEIGVDDYLCKPFDAEMLLLRIRNILALRNRYKQRFSTSSNVEELHIKEESKDQAFIAKAADLMKRHYADPEYTLENFVRDMGYSKTLVNRKMQALTGQPIGQFMKGYRLNVAYKMMAESTGETNVSEVAYAVGFNDPKYFTKCFKELFGCLPSALLKKSD